MTSSHMRKRFCCVIRRRSVRDNMTSFDVMTKYGICVASQNKEVNTFERVQNSELEERIKDKTAQITVGKIIHYKF